MFVCIYITYFGQRKDLDQAALVFSVIIINTYLDRRSELIIVSSYVYMSLVLL